MQNQLSVKCDLCLKASQAGGNLVCPACRTGLKIPGLSELKKQPAGATIGVSELEQIIRAIDKRQSPFDGKCQLCSHGQGTNLLPVTVFYVECEEPKTFGIPCRFCDLCTGDVQRNLRYGVLSNLARNLGKCLWLLFMLPVVIFVAMALPFIGIFFVLGTMSALYYQVTRRRANPFLVRHLNQICHFTQVMEDFDEYVVRHGRIRVGCQDSPWE